MLKAGASRLAPSSRIGSLAKAGLSPLLLAMTALLAPGTPLILPVVEM
jgi:hypothetical protein